MMDTIPTHFEALDERFAGVAGDDVVERLHFGTRWAEGPVYFPAGRFLVWSDIPNDRMLRWDEMTGAVGPFRRPAGYVNGNTLDRQGRLVSCEQGNRRVTRTEHDGSITVIADRWRGNRLNSPNDVVVRSDGSIWFTDPPYGITSDYEGVRAEQEIDGCHVYRADPVTGRVEIVADDFERPNGLAFSPDESRLYVADTRRRHLRVFDVDADGALSGGAVLAETGDALLRPRRHADRHAAPARSRRQPGLRRAQAQPAVHRRLHLALLADAERDGSPAGVGLITPSGRAAPRARRRAPARRP
ncbi:MAG: gluconolactonase [Nonomuraea muscovyensis]|nr:gluconolactonase [Nonomuraea muscovyensis]